MRKWLAAIVAAVALAHGAVARAQGAFPTRPVRLIVNSQAGGTVDVTTRILAEDLQKTWGQPVVVDNIVGAGGNLGAAQAMRAEPDGHTLLVSHPGPLTINPLLIRGTPFDPVKFAPVSVLVSFPNLLVVSKALGVTSLSELIDVARRNPGRTYGSQGVGTTTHLTGSLLGARAGVVLTHVPYRGSPAALLDLTGGRLDMMFDNIGTALPQHEAGATRIIAVAGDRRLPRLPDVPTMSEAGLPGFRSVAWFALMGPDGLPGALAERINRDVVASLRKPELIARFSALNIEAVGNAPDEARAFIADENILWSKVVRDANITPE